jgi:hypothetical protein
MAKKRKEKKVKIKRKRTAKKSKPKKRSTRKVGVLTPAVSDETPGPAGASTPPLKGPPEIY